MPPQDPFAAYVVQPAPTADPFAAFTVTPRKPAATEDFLPPQKASSFLDSATNFVTNFAHTVNPVPALKALYDIHHGMLSGDPEAAGKALALVKGVGQAQIEQFKKAKTAYQEGRISEAVGHTMAGALPLVGPAAASAGEQIGSGDVAGGLGTAAGLTAPFALQDAAKLVPRVGLRGMATTDPAVARAIATGEAAGVPIDAATATGNKFVQGVQKLADESMLGSVVGGRAKAAQQTALASMGEQLAAKAHPVPVSPNAAGAAARQAVGEVISTQRAAANDAYTRLRELEARPENVVEIAPDIAPPDLNASATFTMKPTATVDEIFTEALKDAREHGYTGKVGELRAKFDTAVEQARSLKAATAEGEAYGDKALLKSIRDLGGLRMFEKDFTPGAPTARLTTEADNVKGFFRGQRVYTENGLASDDLVDQLRQDPRWAQRLPPDADMHEVLRDIATREQSGAGGNLEHYLRGAGVQPGVQWWREGEAAQRVPMAVDHTELKAAIRPMFDRLMAKKAIVGTLMGSEGQAAAKLGAILEGPDFAPLSVSDAALSDLKAMARSTNPDLRTTGQGIAARAVANLHKAVGEAAERAGPEAVQALEEGRTATKAKYAAADILKRVAGRQGTKTDLSAFRSVAGYDDANVGTLKDVLTQAPQTKPLIGRAVLDGILDAPRGPDAKFTMWQKIGPETKQALFTPEHVQALDDFFLLSKKIAENPNASGSGTIAAKGAELVLKKAGITLTAPMVSALLHSPTGVKLLTRGFRLPAASTVAQGAYVSALSKALRDVGQPGLTPAFASGPDQQ